MARPLPGRLGSIQLGVVHAVRAVSVGGGDNAPITTTCCWAARSSAAADCRTQWPPEPGYTRIPLVQRYHLDQGPEAGTVCTAQYQG
jgi:hypothetical protein